MGVIMKTTILKYIALLALISVLATIALITITHEQYVAITVECSVNNCKCWSEVVEVPINTLINVSFIHSVHLTPEYDILMVKKDGFYLYEVWTQSFGAGVPVTPEDVGGGTIKYIGDYVVIKSINKFLGKQISIDIKNAYNMTIIIGNHIYDLSKCKGVLTLKIP